MTEPLHPSVGSAQSFRRSVALVALLALAARLRPVLTAADVAAGAAAGLLCLVAELTPRMRRLRELMTVVTGGALGVLAFSYPSTWLFVSLCWLGVLGCAPDGSPRDRRWRLIAVGMGIALPAALYGTLALVSTDARSAIKLAFRLKLSLWEMGVTAAEAFVMGALAAQLIERSDDFEQRRRKSAFTWLALGCVGLVLARRLAGIASVATLPTDLLAWSEAPALLNLLKLRTGEAFYGPLEQINSYSYSPGMELLQYSVLRPFSLELSLRSHRVLGLLWQLASSLVLWRALWPEVRGRLSPLLGRFEAALLLGTLMCVMFSSLLAPNVHPDHALMLCFAAAIALVVKDGSPRMGEQLALVGVPILATMFKLTGAGIGLGLFVAYAFARDKRRTLLLGVGGVLSVATIWLFDATLGQFSTYAIRLQSSHPIEWARILEVPASAPGLIYLAAIVVVMLARRHRPQEHRVQAAMRVLIVTAGFGLPSLLAYLKHGGRENSLLPLAVGGVVAVLLAAASSSEAISSEKSLSAALWAPSLLLSMVLLVSPRLDPLAEETREAFRSMHDRVVAWLREGRAHDQRLLTISMAAYLESGARSVPLDSLNAAAELKLGNYPEFHFFEERVTSGYYAGLMLTNKALLDEKLLPSRVEEIYRVVGPPELLGQWPSDLQGYVMLELKSPPLLKDTR